jgi:hypothetical protein
MSISVKSPQAFQALVQQSPAQAKAWLKEVAEHSDGLLPADQLKAIETLANLKTDAFAQQAGTLPLDALFGTAAVATADNPSADLPVIHGKLTVDRGTNMRVGDQGYREWPDLKLTLKTDDGRELQLQSDHNQKNDIFQFVPGTDVMAFAGQDVSLRGFIDESGKALRVTEFAPGKVPDFVTGRVVVNGDNVSVRVRGRGMVEVSDPQLKAQLSTHNNLGVILEGKTAEQPQPDGTIKRVFEGADQEYWMLVRLTSAPTAGADGKLTAPVQAATSRSNGKVELTPEEAQKIEVNDRMYVKGRFEGPDIKASKATPSAGSPWTTASAGRASPMKSVIEFTEAQEPV